MGYRRRSQRYFACGMCLWRPRLIFGFHSSRNRRPRRAHWLSQSLVGTLRLARRGRLSRMPYLHSAFRELRSAGLIVPLSGLKSGKETPVHYFPPNADRVVRAGLQLLAIPDAAVMKRVLNGLTRVGYKARLPEWTKEVLEKDGTRATEPERLAALRATLTVSRSSALCVQTRGTNRPFRWQTSQQTEPLVAAESRYFDHVFVERSGAGVEPTQPWAARPHWF
jgi:hypothetical protein